MQLVDIKNDLAKIIYTPLNRELCLADFLIIGDLNNNVLAQIIHIETTKKTNANLALAKLILSVDKNGAISPYNGYVPSKDAQISFMEPEEIVQLLKLTGKTMPWGSLASHKEAFVSLDVNLLKNYPYIQCDSAENTSIIASNIIAGLNKNNQKVVILDFESTYDDIKTTKYEIVKDFKLPLNFETLNYIYENDLEGMDLKSKAIIQDILLDLQKYVRTSKSKNGFIPFDTFRQIVENEYRANPNAGIILLRNKLIQYEQQGLFACSKEEFEFVSKVIKQEDIAFFDVSCVRPVWQKIVLEFVMSQIKTESFLILNLSQTNSDKKIISKLYKSLKDVYPVITTTYSYPEAQLLKGIAKNLVLFTPIESLNDFACYNSFLSKLNYDEFIIWGQDTLNIPLILKLTSFGKTHLSTSERLEISKCVDEIFKAPNSSDVVSSESGVGIDENDVTQTQNNEPAIIEQIVPEVKTPAENIEITEYTQAENIIDTIMPENEVKPPAEDAYNIQENISSEIEMPIETQQENIVEDEPLNIMQNTIAPPQNIFDAENDLGNTDDNYEIKENESEIISDSENELIYSDDILSMIDELPDIEETEEIVEEDDDVFQSVENVVSSDEHGVLPDIEITENTDNIEYDNVLSDEDLDFIDEFNEDTENAEIPLFDAETENNSNAIGAENCREGMFVYHPKYGKGVIEKIISYGNKTLCSIQFDNVGRRLLDPNVAELNPA